jgi:group I intron endonuclease
MSINKALVKYGYSDFSLLILEYCEPDLCIEREQYYIDLYKPEYNILKLAGSSLGYTHTEETLAKLRDLEVSVERRALMSENFRGEKNPMFVIFFIILFLQYEIIMKIKIYLKIK